ncbi:hypothetical protein EYC80_005345 [Monilinia laxa]|uniref:Uncharacterized protein n=1 Tax=Monilinia laxa TaxID=61186 RepID=A0A5N6KJP1_MONLA|nr:hypothetical protein EYC80_005345 [Monilinia laxa]
MERGLRIHHHHSHIPKDIRLPILKDLHHPINMIHKIHLMEYHHNNIMAQLVNIHSMVLLNIRLHLEVYPSHNIINTRDLHLISLAQAPQVDMVRLNININNNSTKDNISSTSNINMVGRLDQRCQGVCMVVVGLHQSHMEVILNTVNNTNTNIMARKVDLVITLLLLLGILLSQDGSLPIIL